MTFLKLVRAGFHGLLLFLLPWGVGGLSSLVFDTREVEESSGELTRDFALFTVPLLFAQLVAISVKVGRERRALREAGVRGFSVAGSSASILCPVTSGLTWKVETSNILNGPWTAATVEPNSPGGLRTFSAPATGARVFYRVVPAN